MSCALCYTLRSPFGVRWGLTIQGLILVLWARDFSTASPKGAHRYHGYLASSRNLLSWEETHYRVTIPKRA